MQAFFMFVSGIDFWHLSLMAVFVLFCIVVYRLDKAPDTLFKFKDFFTSGDWPGKASVSRLCYFGGFLAHSLWLSHVEMKRDGLDYAAASLYALIWSGAYVVLKAIELRTPAIPGGDHGQQGSAGTDQIESAGGSKKGAVVPGDESPGGVGSSSQRSP